MPAIVNPIEIATVPKGFKILLIFAVQNDDNIVKTDNKIVNIPCASFARSKVALIAGQQLPTNGTGTQRDIKIR
jgi:hypothetical protein